MRLARAAYDTATSRVRTIGRKVFITLLIRKRQFFSIHSKMIKLFIFLITTHVDSIFIKQRTPKLVRCAYIYDLHRHVCRVTPTLFVPRSDIVEIKEYPIGFVYSCIMRVICAVQGPE